MNWKELSSVDQIKDIVESSMEKPTVIFKHSTRCSISAMVLNRLERKWKESEVDFYFLDLIRYRDVSNEIERTLNIPHESPQAIALVNRKVVYDASHNGIDFDDIISVSSKATIA